MKLRRRTISYYDVYLWQGINQAISCQNFRERILHPTKFTKFPQPIQLKFIIQFYERRNLHLSLWFLKILAENDTQYWNNSLYTDEKSYLNKQNTTYLMLTFPFLLIRIINKISIKWRNTTALVRWLDLTTAVVNRKEIVTQCMSVWQNCDVSRDAIKLFALDI